MVAEIKEKQKNIVENAIYQQALNTRKQRTVFLIASLIFIFILSRIFPIDIPKQIFFLIFSLALLFLAFMYVVKRAKSLTGLENLYTIFSFLEIVILTFIIHYLGGVEWIGIMLYMFIIVEMNTVLPFKKGLAITLLAIVSFISLVFLEFFEIIPHRAFFIAGPELFQNTFYVLFTLLTGILIVFIFVTQISSNFSGLFKRQANALEKARGELETSKTTLEIKVQARTEELRELTESLEGKVGKRTNELEKERKELAERVSELERFHKLAVGRELKMRELKKEITELKKKITKQETS